MQADVRTTRRDRSDGPARRTALAAALALLAWGCGGEAEDAAVPEAPAAPAATTEAVPARAGGESIPLQRYVAPEGFPLEFATYIPSDFDAEFPFDDEGSAIAFTWDDGRELRDSAFVHLYVLPEERGEEAARALVRTVAERYRVPGNRTEPDPVQRHDWAVVEYPIESRGVVGGGVEGWVALGRAGDRWFYTIVQSSTERWPRFRPRAELILEGLRWGAPAPD